MRRIREDACVAPNCELLVFRPGQRVAKMTHDFTFRFSHVVLEARRLQGWPGSKLKIRSSRIMLPEHVLVSKPYVLYRDPPGTRASRGAGWLVDALKHTHREIAVYDLGDGARAVLVRRRGSRFDQE